MLELGFYFCPLKNYLQGWRHRNGHDTLRYAMALAVNGFGHICTKYEQLVDVHN